MFSIYTWENVKENSPHPQTRNEWLFKYGAIACYKGLWFPCKITHETTIGEPAYVMVQRNSSINQEIYPTGRVPVTDLDVLYTVFRNGLSLEQYIKNAMLRKNITSKMLDSAIMRSVNTEIISAPKKLIQQIKEAVNSMVRGETRVVTPFVGQDIQVLKMNNTADILEKLWNSNDWAMQEISQLLGLSFNPAHGKKERMVKSELLGDRDITIMNRELVTSRLKTSAEKFGEKVEHISNYIDTLDRGLQYIGGGKSVLSSDRLYEQEQQQKSEI